jgi:hypothetical protein
LRINASNNSSKIETVAVLLVPPERAKGTHETLNPKDGHFLGCAIRVCAVIVAKKNAKYRTLFALGR